MKTIRTFAVIFLLCSLHLVACNSRSSEPSQYSLAEVETDQVDALAPLPPPVAKFNESQENEWATETVDLQLVADNSTTAPADASVVVSQKQIIKTAQVKIQVEKLKESKTVVTKLVNNAGGYLASANEANSNGDRTATFTIRVPAAKFENLLEELLKQAVFVAYNNVSAEDVTEEFVDIQTRLKTKRALEARYLELLKQAKSMADVLKLEAALQTIREEIESKEGRLKYLQSQVGFSTINLEMYEQVPYTAEPSLGFWHKLGSGFGQGWEMFLEFAIGLITLWPFWLVMAGVIWLIRRWWHSRRRGKVDAA